MTFSVIIPTLNEAENIRACLLSIKNQTLPYEIILVDGGSTDKTIAIAKPLVNKVIHSNQGRATQMNRGAQRANGDILLFLHADTLLPDNALENIDAHFKQKNNSWGRFNIALSGDHFMLTVIALMMNWRSYLSGIVTGDQVIFVSKTLFQQIGGFPEIALMEDVKLSSLLKKTSRPLCLKTKVISSGRRWEQRGIFKTILLMWSLRLRYFLGENPETLRILYAKGTIWKT